MDQEAKVRCGVGQDFFCDTEHFFFFFFLPKGGGGGGGQNEIV